LVWTTTPWTLPGNVAVAVNPDLTYVQLEVNQESLILAKERVADLKIEGRALKEIKGKNLVGLSYESPYPLNEEVEKTAYKVISGDFVSLKEGTGLVHIAPAFGEEDMEAIKNENAKLKQQKTGQFPVLVTVDEEGRFRLEVKKWAGLFVKDADPLIISDLRERGFLLKEEQYQHDYPFCWRCRTPLLYYAINGWFIGIKKVKKELIENNEKINWV
jgi:isoleucyl-tRNA synthetase